MRKIWIITVAALLASAAVLSAQDKPDEKVQLSGQVIDAATRAPIPTAIVRIEGLHRAVVADSAGRFSIDKLPKGPLWVDVVRLGYTAAMLDIRLMADDTMTIELTPQPLVLQAVTAVANRLESRRNRAHMMVRAFDAARLATSTSNLRQFLTSFAAPITACPAGRNRFAEENCVIARGDYRALHVFVNEMPYAGAHLDLYYPQEFELVEYYPGSYMLRLYTTAFLERVAKGKAFISPTL